MLVKYKTAAILMVIVMVCATTVLAASGRINKLELSRDGSFTVLTIQGNSPLKFAHQSIEAKQGKPFRIVIDCLAARHDLARKAYDDLPESIIQAIRTSQYAVTPEEVVRVVLDLSEESVYRVESEGNSIKVYVSDKKTAPFENWRSSKNNFKPSIVSQKPSTAGTKLKGKPAPSKEKPAATVATAAQSQPAVPSVAKKPSVVKQKVNRANKTTGISPYIAKLPPPSKNEKYGLVLASAPKTPDQTATVQEEKPTPDKPAAKKAETPESPTPSAKQPTTVASKTDKVKSEPKPQTQMKPSQPSANAQPEIKKDLAGDTIARTKVFASLESKSTQTPEPGMNTAPSKADQKDTRKTAKPGTSKSTPSVPSSVTDDKKPALASLDEAGQKPAAPGADNKEDTVDEIKTSRYRRESAKSAELKATQVVQFPQRMVIKYRHGSTRDPFESLISIDKQRKGNVDLNRVPNVETLNLVGILQPFLGKGAALMEDMDGIGYILRPGDRVRNGYVAQIDKQAIYFQINEYGWGRTVVKHMEKEN